jgi:hypothetical protein
LFENFRDATPLSSDSLTYKKSAAILLFTSAKCPPPSPSVAFKTFLCVTSLKLVNDNVTWCSFCHVSCVWDYLYFFNLTV